MDTDFDHDDALGHRMRALFAWQPVTAREEAWEHVQRRRRRARARHGLLGSGTLLLAIATIAVFVNFSFSNTPRHVTVVGAAPARNYRPVAPTGSIKVTTAGPYRAGQQVRVTITPTSTFRAEDPANQGLDLCYRWSRGENCDPSIRSAYVDTDAKGVVTFTVRLPGWVYTPTGLRACREVQCRVEYQNSPSRKIGSKVLDIDSGPRPQLPARITSVAPDARIGVHLDAIRPDPSWTRWARSVGPDARKTLPPGHIGICSFTDLFECDQLVRPPAPAFDGKPHESVVRTNRLLLTPRGWVDCVAVQCAIVITRNIGVTGGAGTVASDAEIIAILAYRLPTTAAVMKQPTLTIASHPPVHVGDTLTVTLHDPPPNVDPARRLFLGQCATDDIRRANDCRIRFADGDGQTQAWTRRPDGSLRQRWEVVRCSDPSGCYLAIQPPAKGWPAVARTARFAVRP